MGGRCKYFPFCVPIRFNFRFQFFLPPSVRSKLIEIQNKIDFSDSRTWLADFRPAEWDLSWFSFGLFSLDFCDWLQMVFFNLCIQCVFYRSIERVNFRRLFNRLTIGMFLVWAVHVAADVVIFVLIYTKQRAIDAGKK